MCSHERVELQSKGVLTQADQLLYENEARDRIRDIINHWTGGHNLPVWKPLECTGFFIFAEKKLNGRMKTMTIASSELNQLAVEYQ